MKECLISIIDAIKDSLCEINDFLYENPELGDQEYLACQKLVAFLGSHQFKVEVGIVGKPTAFKAVYDSFKIGPTVSFLCEYDALPGVGHGCGHNMIASMSAGAGVALSKVLNEIGGKVIVLGTPAEETNGAKVAMAEQGVFNDIDVAMLLHPSDKTCESGYSLAMEAIQFSFIGKTSHAASEPEKGINALDAAIHTFNGINTFRQYMKSDARIHGIIKEGGIAANIIPDKAVAQFYVRAQEKEYLMEIVEQVKNIARGACLMTGAQLEISNYELSYENLRTNRALSNRFNSNLNLLGVTEIETAKSSFGSLDMGNVSNVVPAIHPYIGLGHSDISGHSREMADLTMTDEAHQALIKGTLALAYTGFDVITDNELLQKIKEEFKRA